MHYYRILITLFLLSFNICGSVNSWEKIDEGLHYGQFLNSDKKLPKRASITIIRINPDKYEFKLLSTTEFNEGEGGITVPQWVKKYNLLGAVNAGMYLTDYLKNVGYMQNFKHKNNGRSNPKYHSFALFNPKSPSSAPFKIVDSDVVDIKEEMKSYNTVIQNLRLIKSPGENRWSQQSKKWSEIALGFDKKGNMLWIFSNYPYSMYDFNNHLLSLDIELVAAHHLEGGPEASLYISHNDTKIMGAGGFDVSVNKSEDKGGYWPIPNIIGIVKR